MMLHFLRSLIVILHRISKNLLCLRNSLPVFVMCCLCTVMYSHCLVHMIIY